MYILYEKNEWPLWWQLIFFFCVYNTWESLKTLLAGRAFINSSMYHELCPLPLPNSRCPWWLGGWRPNLEPSGTWNGHNNISRNWRPKKAKKKVSHVASEPGTFPFHSSLFRIPLSMWMLDVIEHLLSRLCDGCKITKNDITFPFKRKSFQDVNCT